MWSDLTLDPSFKVKRGWPNLKVLFACLLVVLEVCNVKPSYRKSWAGILLMWSDLTLDPFFKVKQGYPNLKALMTRLLLVLEVRNVKSTYRKSWARNLGAFFKVKLRQQNLKVLVTCLLLVPEVCNVKPSPRTRHKFCGLWLRILILLSCSTTFCMYSDLLKVNLFLCQCVNPTA